MADAAAIGLWFVAREARRHVKVVLSGEGADELFGGYGVYYQPGVVRAATKLPASGGRSPQAMADRIPSGQKGKGLLERIATPLRSRYIGNANVFAGRGGRRADQVRRRHRLRRDRPALRPGGGRRAR